MDENKRKCSLGILFRQGTDYWEIEYLVAQLKQFEPYLKFSLIEVPQYDTNKPIHDILPKELPNDLDAIACIPAEGKYLPYILQKNKNLKWVHCMWAGVDKMLQVQEIANNEQIVLTNAKGAYAQSLAQFCIQSMLYFNYHSPHYVKAFLKREWIRPVNLLIGGNTLTIVGYGKNGIEIAKLAKAAFEMHVIAVKKNLQDAEGKEFVDELISIDELNANILQRTDFLVSVLPHTKEMINYYNEEKFSQMKSSSVFINIGRGSSVVEEDLAKCLKNKTIRGAVLDVTQIEPLPKDSPLYDLDIESILLSCHSADNSDRAFKQPAGVLIDNIKSFLNNGKPVTIVNKKNGY